MNLKELYQDIILEHGKSPRNFGKCHGYNHEAKGHNPLCGDQVQVYLKLNENKKVENVTFEGSGCAISIASTSIMTELVKGKAFDVAKKIVEEFLSMIKDGKEIKTNNLNEDQKTKIMSLSGVKQYPMRVKCATLSWHTLVSAIDGEKKEVNTEIKINE
jgi:nitrogen fixation NifU-like protein